MKPRFQVPLLPPAFLHDNLQGVPREDALEYAGSNEYVLHENFPFDWVELVRPQWRSVDPNPLYVLVRQSYGGRLVRSEPVRAVRLSIIRPGMTVYLERFTNRPQITCLDDKGVRHIIASHGPYSSEILCSGEFIRREGRFEKGVPTCEACLREKLAEWLPFVVQPYEHPKKVAKAEHKIKAKARVRERFPTAHERIATDWLED